MSTRHLDDLRVSLMMRHRNNPGRSLARNRFSILNNRRTIAGVDAGGPAVEGLERFACNLMNSLTFKHPTFFKILNEECCAIHDFGLNEDLHQTLNDFVLSMFFA